MDTVLRHTIAVLIILASIIWFAASTKRADVQYSMIEDILERVDRPLGVHRYKVLSMGSPSTDIACTRILLSGSRKTLTNEWWMRIYDNVSERSMIVCAQQMMGSHIVQDRLDVLFDD